MDYDISISIGTEAQLDGVKKAQKAVGDLGKAIDGLPSEVIPGGVGGVQEAAYTGSGSAGGGMSWRLEGAGELARAVTSAERSVSGATRAVERNTGALGRSVRALGALGGRLQAWSGRAMDQFNRFNGGLQNAFNLVNLGKQAWDVGMSAGEALNRAFGLGVKKVNDQLADQLAKAKAKVEAWQALLSAEGARMGQEKVLKEEEGMVKRINDAYEARKRVIEALDEKATRQLEMQGRLLEIENEKNRSIIRQKELRGELTEGQARDELAKLDAKGARERRELERKQAENEVAKSVALAEAKRDEVKKMKEFVGSSEGIGGVASLSEGDFYQAADAYKAADGMLKDWTGLVARRKRLKEELEEIDGEKKAAVLMGPAGAALALGLDQKREQRENDLSHVEGLMTGMRGEWGLGAGAADKDVLSRLVKARKKAGEGLDEMMERVRKTGLLGDLRGKSGDELYVAYAEGLKKAKEVIGNRTEVMTKLFTEQADLDREVENAKSRLDKLKVVQDAEVKAEEAVTAETGRTNAVADSKKHDSLLAGGLAEELARGAEKQRVAAEGMSKVADDAEKQMDKALELLNQYAEKYEGTKLSGGIERLLTTVQRLQGKAVNDRSKEDVADLKWLRGWIKAVDSHGGYDSLVRASKGVLDNMDKVLVAERKRKLAETKAKGLEERSKKLADVSGQLDSMERGALSLDDWLEKNRKRITNKMGSLSDKDKSGRMLSANDLVNRVLDDKSAGGKRVTQKEAGQLTALLKQLKAVKKEDRSGEMQEAIGIISELIGVYRATSREQSRTLADLQRLRQEVRQIKGQSKNNPLRES